MLGATRKWVDRRMAQAEQHNAVAPTSAIAPGLLGAQPLMQGRSVVAPPAPTSTIWDSTATPSTTPLGAKTEGVINDMLSGAAFNPHAIQMREALGRAEANQRASTASQIHQAGFSGTPLGAGVGNAAEGALLRNRFDTNLGIEVARQGMKQDGAQMALGYADQANRFALDRERLGMEKDRFVQEQAANESVLRDKAMGDLAAASQQNPQWMTAIESSDPMLLAGLMNDPVFKRTMQEAWERQGGQGQFDMNWTAQQMTNIRDKENAVLQARNALMQIPGVTEGLADKILSERGLAALGYRLVMDENDVPKLESIDDEVVVATDWNITNPFNNNKAAAILDDPDQKDSQEYNDIITRMAAMYKDGSAAAERIIALASSPAWEDIIGELKNNGSLVVGTGNSASYKDGRRYYPSLTNARSTGSLVEFNGNIGQVTGSKDVGNVRGSRWVEYTITFLDGTTKKVRS